MSEDNPVSFIDLHYAHRISRKRRAGEALKICVITDDFMAAIHSIVKALGNEVRAYHVNRRMMIIGENEYYFFTEPNSMLGWEFDAWGVYDLWTDVPSGWWKEMIDMAKSRTQ